MTGLFRGRALALATLTAAHLALAWLLAAAVTLPLLAPLARHPDGPFALYTEGGRVLLEVARDGEQSLMVAGASAALVAALYALGWLAFGGLLPALGAVEPAPPLHRAASHSLRRLPTLAALAAGALAGYALAGVAGWLAYRWLRGAGAHLADGRAADLLAARAALPALAIAAAVTVWHDLARVSAVGSGGSAAAAAGDAFTWMLRMPLRTLGAAAAYALAGLAGPLVAYGASFAWGGRAGAAAVALTLTQQLALAWRFGCRAGWFFHLGALFRERASSRGGDGGDA